MIVELIATLTVFLVYLYSVAIILNKIDKVEKRNLKR